MPQRVMITVLGATLAPYSSNNLTPPQFINGGLSEQWGVEVAQLQRGVDTTVAQQAVYPAALSQVSLKFVHGSHFNSVTLYLNISAETLNSICG